MLIKLLETVKFFHCEIIDSTNNLALQLLNEMQFSKNRQEKYIAVTAGFQTKGRGRNNKFWFGETNSNIYFSLALNHNPDQIPLYLLQVIGSLASYKVLSQFVAAPFIKIKYPNDIYVFEKKCSKFKKISGIISETNYFSEKKCNSVIGIGINVNQTFFPPEIADTATSLRLLGIEQDMQKLIKELAINIVNLLSDNPQKIIEDWSNIVDITDKSVILLSEPDKKYFAEKILPDCRLILVDNYEKKLIIDNGDSIRYEF